MDPRDLNNPAEGPALESTDPRDPAPLAKAKSKGKAKAPVEIPKAASADEAVDRRAFLEREMAEVGKGIRDMQKHLDAVNLEYANLVKAEPEPTPQEKFAADSAHYRKSQALLREKRAERLKMLRESNIDIRDLRSVMSPSALDAAMARKRERGGKRPQFFEVASPTKGADLKQTGS